MQKGVELGKRTRCSNDCAEWLTVSRGRAEGRQ